MATYTYSGQEVMKINHPFLYTMFDNYKTLKAKYEISETKEVGWSFFHRDDLKRALANDSIGCGFVYMANDPSIIYPSDKNTYTDVPKNKDIETIIVLTGVKKEPNAAPLFFARKNNSENIEGVVIASLEPCPKKCIPPMEPEQLTECFDLIYKSGLIVGTNTYKTDMGEELDERVFWQCQAKYIDTRDKKYQKFRSAYFSKEAIEEILKDQKCIGIRCGVMLYYNSFRCMFVVGVENNDKRSWQYNNPILCSDLELDLPNPPASTNLAFANSKLIKWSKKQEKKSLKKA
jgi:hypothetical protein